MKVLSNEGFGKYNLIPTESKLVIVTAPGGNSGKMGFAISQIFLNQLQGIKSGFAKYENLPIWNLPLDHPLNISYEFATVNTRDNNLIDNYYHIKNGEKAVTYNRDVENYIILNRLLSNIFKEKIYDSPTEMGINMLKEGIEDDDVVQEASINEIKRRFKIYKEKATFSKKDTENFLRALELIKKYNLTFI